jgi:flavin-dependent dehydrogenase
VPGLADARFRGTPPLTRRRADVAAERLFVLGDAAGYVEPFTGEGMGWAMAGAGAVVPLVRAAVAGWHPRLAERWRERHAAVVMRRQAICRAVAALLRRPLLTRTAVRILEAAPTLARPFLTHLNTPPREDAA